MQLVPHAVPQVEVHPHDPVDVQHGAGAEVPQEPVVQVEVVVAVVRIRAAWEPAKRKAPRKMA